MDATPVFESLSEEVTYWKEKASFYKSGYDDLKKEYDEYQDDSKLLEAELETQLKQNEKKIDTLSINLTRVKDENEQLKANLEQMRKEHSAQMTELSTEVASCRKTGDKLNNYVRTLEQKNDDLERHNRAASVSIEDFETKLNGLIERNAFLESEIEEKENLRTIVQRLKDETRDLKSELQVKGEPQDSNRLESNRPRLSPLSIVNDLLKKVGALETKLATYHNARVKRTKQVKS